MNVMNSKTNKLTSRACVFIDSSNPLLPSTVINSAQPFIKLPFPPTIEPRDLLKKTRDGGMSKPPNAFIIYRKWFIETARSEGYFLPMTVISSMASQSWEQESPSVKAEYKRLGKEAFKIRNDMLPKSVRRRKREKWNIVKFEEVKFEPKLPKLVKTTSKPPPSKNLLDDQYPLSPPPETISTESTESTPSTPTTSPLTSPIISPSSSDKELTQFMIPSPIRSTFDETFIDGTDEANKLNHWFPSSEPSSISSPENSEQYLLNLESSDSSTFELFDSPIIDLNHLILEQQSQRQQSSYLDDLEINTANNLYNEFSSKFTFDISSQDFLTNESSGNFYYM